MDRYRSCLKSTPLASEYRALESEKAAGRDGKVVRTSRWFTIEPLILGVTFCTASSNAIITNLITRQACLDLGASSTDECQRNATFENEAQKVAANVQAINVALSTIVPIVAFIFIGPWSDSNGRKPILNLVVFGHFFHFLLYTILASIVNLRPMWLITPSVVMMLTGGPSAFILLTVCYISDVSSERNKTFRIGLGFACSVVSGGTGPLGGNLLYGGGSPQGFIRVFAMNAAVCAVMSVYSYCFLPESVTKEKETGERLFAWSHCLGILKFFKKKRPGKQLITIFLILLIEISCTGFIAGESEVLFLSLKKQFHWDIDQFSKFSVFTQALSCFYTTFGIWLLCSFFKVGDFATLSGILVVYIIAMITFANARTITMVIVSNGIGSCGRMSFPLYKSMITKAVDVKEIGTALTVAQIWESLFSSIFSGVYAKIYGIVVSKSPLEIYYVSASFAALGLVTVLILQLVRRSKAEKMQPLE